MNQILNQLGGLFLGSVPTIVFFLLLVAAYGLLVRGPLDAVLLERRNRTSGAVEQARLAFSNAEQQTELFEEKLRAAHNELTAARGQRLKQLASERDRTLNEARLETQAKVLAARLAVEQNVSSARQQLDSVTTDLSLQVLKAILPPGVAEVGVVQ